MSLFDSIKGSLGGVLGEAAASALPGIIERVVPGGLEGLLLKLQQSGLGAQVNSWLGRGPNEPITAEDVNRVLGDQHVRDIAAKLGIPADQVAALISQLLPAAVDKASPDGKLHTPAA